MKLRRVHPEGFEPSTYGSVGREFHNRISIGTITVVMTYDLQKNHSGLKRFALFYVHFHWISSVL